MKSTENDNITDFETALGELEKIVKQLEGDVKLSEAVSLFEQGSKYSAICQKHLNTATQKIEILKKQSNGEIVLESVNSELEST